MSVNAPKCGAGGKARQPHTASNAVRRQRYGTAKAHHTHRPSPQPQPRRRETGQLVGRGWNPRLRGNRVQHATAQASLIPPECSTGSVRAELLQARACASHAASCYIPGGRGCCTRARCVSSGRPQGTKAQPAWRRRHATARVGSSRVVAEVQDRQNRFWASKCMGRGGGEALQGFQGGNRMVRQCIMKEAQQGGGRGYARGASDLSSY